MLKIAIMCLEGKETKKDLNEAEYWAEKAWERGNTSGAYVMGLIKEEEHNLSSSAIWFKKGSGKSDGDCCLRYGLCFLDGKGVERNVQEALFFIEQARHLKLKYCKQFEIFNAYIRAKEASGS